MHALVIGALVACGGTPPPAHWESDEATALARANREHAELLVSVYADWSVPNMQLDRQLHALDLVHCVPLRVDITQSDPRSEAIAQRYAGTAMLAIAHADGSVVARLDRVPTDAELRAFLKTCLQ